MYTVYGKKAIPPGKGGHGGHRGFGGNGGQTILFGVEKDPLFIITALRGIDTFILL